MSGSLDDTGSELNNQKLISQQMQRNLAREDADIDMGRVKMEASSYVYELIHTIGIDG